MFIKLKLEQNDENSNDQDTYFEIEKNMSIADLKWQLEPFVNMESSYMELRSLNTTYKDNEKLGMLWANEQKEGASIMLYAYPFEIDNFADNDPQFFCFLQLYDTKEALMAASVKNRPTPNVTSPSDFSTVNLVAISDSEETSQGSCSSSDSETDTSDSSDDSSSTERGKDLCGRKRRKNAKKEVVMKRIKTQNKKLPSTLSKYLDEFPDYPDKQPACSKHIEPTPTTITKESPSAKQSELNINFEEVVSSKLGEQKLVEPSAKKANAELVQKTATTNSSIKKPSASNAEASMINIVLGKLKFMVLISGKEAMQKSDCVLILNIFFEKFKEFVQVSSLSFADGSAFVLRNGELWITCEDEATCGWMLENVKRLPTKYSGMRFRDFYFTYEVIIPKVCKSSDVEVLQLLERQNTALKTRKWSVLKRKPLPEGENGENYRMVCAFCENELLTLLIDKENVNILKELDYRLKYCFWKVEFHAVTV